VNQSLNELQSTLELDGANVNPVDTTGIDQSLNDLQNSLQGTDVPTPATSPCGYARSEPKQPSTDPASTGGALTLLPF
jgi:hypothetical protein